MAYGRRRRRFATAVVAVLVISFIAWIVLGAASAIWR